MYLNTIYYGHAAYGIEAAAQTYFGKCAADLSLGEAALLAGLPKGPSYYSPHLNPEAAEQRQRTVLSQMVSAGFIDEDEKETALREQLGFRELSDEESPAYFLEYVINTELAEFFNGDLNPVYRDGLNIYTTINPDMQQLAQRPLPESPRCASMKMERGNPRGRWWQLSRYRLCQGDGGGRLQRNKFKPCSARSPGSTFKLLFTAALENGLPARLVSCEAVA